MAGCNQVVSFKRTFREIPLNPALRLSKLDFREKLLCIFGKLEIFFYDAEMITKIQMILRN